jgi:hypothetical protein
VILATIAILSAGAIFFTMRTESQRRERYDEAIAYGARMEQNLRFGEAVQTYDSALRLDLTDHERADLRYRLARSKIRGNNPQGALGIIQELIAEDASRFNLDIGPLCLEGGEKAMALDQLPLARILLRLGRGVSPDRYEDFSRRLDSMLKPPPEPPSGVESDGS